MRIYRCLGSVRNAPESYSDLPISAIESEKLAIAANVWFPPFLCHVAGAASEKRLLGVGASTATKSAQPTLDLSGLPKN